MTTAPEGSGSPGTPDDGKAAPGKADDKGSPPAAAGAVDFMSGLDTDTRTWVEKAGFKIDDPAALVAGLAGKALNAEKLIGGSIRLPAADAKPEELESFYNKLGRPDAPAGYEFKPPENMPEDVPYNQQFADWFRGAAHKAGLSKAAASSLHDEFVKMAVQSATADIEARQAAGTAALEKAWGPSGSKEFRANVEFADKGIKAVGGEKLLSSLKANGLLGKGGEVLDPVIAEAFAMVGRSLGSEGQLVLGDGGTGGVNPFGKDTENLTQQSVVIRKDPDRARSLIIAAGRQPSDFGL